MTRRILCKDCGRGWWDLSSEDRYLGIDCRRLLVELGPVPAGLGVQITTMEPDGTIHKSPKELATVIKCDSCGNEIPQGEKAWAVTTWNTHREGQPDSWEDDYGIII